MFRDELTLPFCQKPYVGRSEFLMNRIVKRQEAAPPFVEMQKEMRDEMNGFRARLRETWIRRATRMLSLQPITPSVIGECGEYRDSEWTARERGYHDTAVKNINNLIRKYNIVAPPTARALFTTVELELAACYKDCQPLIKEELERRVRAGMGTPRGAGVIQGPLRGPKGRIEAEEGAVKESMLSAFRRFVREVVGSKA
jgi:DnaJ family protein C protein 28